MMAQGLTWGDLRAIHAEAQRTGGVRSDDLLANPEFAKHDAEHADSDLVYPPEEGT